MGASSSHQQDSFDRTNFGSSFKRSSSLRHSKSKGSTRASQRKMDKIRSSFRESFRRKKEVTSDISKQQQWQIDSADVRAGTCLFHVKYLGCLEVFESRGMQVCEEALKLLKNTRRRPVKAILYVSGDGLRVVEDDTKGLIVDQTIEKVSFCAPDRNHERGFSYICRDGTTRRWLCHGFIAVNESGERLSHAVGCAFALCLERKQTREKENVNAGTTNSDSDAKNSNSKNLNTTGTNTLSTITAVAAAAAIPAHIVANYGINYQRKESLPARKTPVPDLHPIERPHATYSMLQRQGSFRGLSHLNHASPFKRQLSLKISDLPSNLERTRLRTLIRSSESTAPVPTTSITAASTTGGSEHGINNAFIAKVDAVSLQTCDEIGIRNTELDRNYSALLTSNHNRSAEDLRESLKGTASFTPPATPPPSVVSDLPHPEQWLGKVSEITSNISELTANITELASNISPSKSPSTIKRFPLITQHGRAHSLGSGENRYSIKKDGTNSSDPFDAEWVSEVAPNIKSTNPFLSNITDNTAS